MVGYLLFFLFRYSILRTVRPNYEPLSLSDPASKSSKLDPMLIGLVKLFLLCFQHCTLCVLEFQCSSTRVSSVSGTSGFSTPVLCCDSDFTADVLQFWHICSLVYIFWFHYGCILVHFRFHYDYILAYFPFIMVVLRFLLHLYFGVLVYRNHGDIFVPHTPLN
jgi:hypothetical protein